MDRVRVGFIGCGGIAQFHFGHMPNIEEVDVVAVCDKVEDRVQAAAERFSFFFFLTTMAYDRRRQNEATRYKVLLSFETVKDC